MYKLNETVFINSFKRKGIITKILNNHEYLITMNSLTMQANEADIRKIEEKDNKKKSKINFRKKTNIQHNNLTKSFDLHGIHLIDLEDTVLKDISDAIMQGCSKIELVHGIGNGILKSALPQILQKISVVRSFEESSNPGVMIVYLQ